MLSKYMEADPRIALQEIRNAAENPTFVRSSLHNFYKYPACFPSPLARSLITHFSKPGDTILDPFVGGGTTAVDAMLTRRHALGIDINDLSIFASKLKTLLLKDGDISELEKWLKYATSSRARWPGTMTREERELFELVPRDLSARIAILRRSASELSPVARHFALGVTLNTARIALDNKHRIPSDEDFLIKLDTEYERMLTEHLQQRIRVPKKDRGSVTLVRADTASHAATRAVAKLDSKPSLVLTSPPYPGISVLYNRWQINGRRETNLPYWIIGSDQDEPASHFTMGHPKTALGQEKYFRSIEASFSNVRSWLKKDTLVIQVVAFSDPRQQLRSYLDAMESAGFREIRNVTTSSYDGRLWRPVASRKWYNNLPERKFDRKEVIFFHAAK
jgi:hypothetical protein